MSKAKAVRLYLAPDLTILDASEGYEEMTHTRLAEMVGRNVFEVFPETPGTRQNIGAPQLRDSLQKAQRGIRDMMLPFRYDIERPDGTWEVRYWQVTNTPEFEGGKVVRIVNEVEDVTWDATTMKARRKQLHRNYLYLNAFVGLVAMLLAISGVSFFFDPAGIEGSLPHVPPWDYYWNGLYAVGGVTVMFGLLSRRVAIEAAGHILYVPGLLLNMVIGIATVGIVHRITFLTLVFAAGAAFRAYGLVAGWSEDQ